MSNDRQTDNDNALSGVERITRTFAAREGAPVVTIFITVGYPEPGTLVRAGTAAVKAGATMLEVGVPFSDSVVDGPTIQECNSVALAAGMTLERYFSEVEELRAEVDVPLVLMGSLNPILAYGVEAFLDACVTAGIDGLIVPELPPEEFLDCWQSSFESRGLAFVPLVTTRSSEARIKFLDEVGSGFVYVVSSEGTTGGALEVAEGLAARIEEIRKLCVKNPVQVGFGIRSAPQVRALAGSVDGVIVGSAFLKSITDQSTLEDDIMQFMEGLIPSSE